MVLSGVLTVSETLGALRSTKNLVSLRLEQIVANRPTSPPTYVTLPKLGQLVITVLSSLSPGAVLLYHMRIPPACLLSFSGKSIHPREIYDQSTLSTILLVISNSARHRFTHHVPRKISLVYWESHFQLRDESHPGKPAFEFSMDLDTEYVLPEHALPMLLNSFTLPKFSEVTEFKFTFMGVHHPVPAFTSFITCLSSVKIIDADKLSVRHLTRAQEALKTADTGPKVAFPALKTLIVVLGLLLPNPSDFNADPVSEFIMMRIAHGHAIETVDLTPIKMNTRPDDMAFLQQADGLKVLWQQRRGGEILEYICGTDTPQNVVSI